MLTAMKILIEKQVKSWQQNPTSSIPGKISACGFRPAASQAALLNSLQNGGCVLTSSYGDTAPELEPNSSLPVFKLSSRVEISPAQSAETEKFFQEVGIDLQGPLQFPEENPITLEPIDWEKEICQSTLKNLSAGSARQAQIEATSQNAKINRLVHLMMLAVRSGNIALAMMMFAHLESSTANQMTQMLMTKVQALQDQKRQLTQDIQNTKNDSEGAKKMQGLQNEVSQANDDIAVLQTFIRDVAQNKQAAIELANAFLSKEHETTMAVVRSFGR